MSLFTSKSNQRISVPQYQMYNQQRLQVPQQEDLEQKQPIIEIQPRQILVSQSELGVVENFKHGFPISSNSLNSTQYIQDNNHQLSNLYTPQHFTQSLMSVSSYSEQPSTVIISSNQDNKWLKYSLGTNQSDQTTQQFPPQTQKQLPDTNNGTLATINQTQNNNNQQKVQCTFVLLKTPSCQYQFLVTGEIHIDLRWVKQNNPEPADESDLNSPILSFRKVARTYKLASNGYLFMEFLNHPAKEQSHQFQFIIHMLESLSTQSSMRLVYLLKNYSLYIEERKRQVEIRREEYSSVNLQERRAVSLSQALSIIGQLDPKDISCSFLGCCDQEDFFETAAKSYSPGLLGILGISSEEMVQISLLGGCTQFWDWQTKLKMSCSRLQIVESGKSQKTWKSFQGSLITFDGFNLNANITNNYITINNILLPSQDPRFNLLNDVLCVMMFSFSCEDLRLLSLYRTTDAAKEYKRNFIEKSILERQSVYKQEEKTHQFMENYYPKEILGVKHKKIRKSKEDAQRESKHFLKLQKNKFKIVESASELP